MNPSIFIILLICLVVSITCLPVKVYKSRPTAGKKVGNVNDTKKVEPSEVFSKILQVNKALEQSALQIVYGDVLKRKSRYAFNCNNCLWPKSADGIAKVPYTLSPSYSVDEQNLFMTSMQEFESLTCVRFVKRTAEVNYLNISSSDGCLSYAGQIGGAQLVGLEAPWCMYRGVIQHEINHALGFLHEIGRSDRDNYIIINYQNIAPGKENNFAIQAGNTLGLPYDYSSVMHYSRFAFSINEALPTIVPIPDPNVPIGQIDGLSVLDVAKINKLYDCNVCSTLLTTPSGTFSSANYPSNYPNNMGCVFLIRTPDRQVSLTFNDFSLQSSPACTSDYMKIYDGPSMSSPVLLDNTCGSVQVPIVIASTNQMLIEFVSDGAATSKGFSASYNTVQCGGTFYTPQKNVTSPGYPNFYSPNMNCIFTITAPVGNKILFSVTDFQLEGGQFCPFDYLVIRDGSAQKGPFCGNYKVPTFTSKGNSLKLTFVSDGGNQFKGFQASYKFV